MAVSELSPRSSTLPRLVWGRAALHCHSPSTKLVYFLAQPGWYCWALLGGRGLHTKLAITYLSLLPPSLSVYTMQLMLECKNVVERLLPIKEKKGLNYTHIGEKALGLFGKWSVNLAVLLCNLGVCAGYMIFISSNSQVNCTVQLVHVFKHVCLVCTIHKLCPNPLCFHTTLQPYSNLYTLCVLYM